MITNIPKSMLKIHLVGIYPDDHEEPHIELIQSMTKPETNWMDKYTTPVPKNMQSNDPDLTFILDWSKDISTFRSGDPMERVLDFLGTLSLTDDKCQYVLVMVDPFTDGLNVYHSPIRLQKL